VPYDKDANMQPCLKKGTKAHWATITGFLLIASREIVNDLSQHEPDCQLSDLLHATQKTCDKSLLIKAINDESITSHNVYVFAKQGKSKYTGLWSLEDLLKSNDNLVEMDPKVPIEIDNPIVPAGGIRAGLKNKLLFLTKS
jgi:hypothetical protein